MKAKSMKLLYFSDPMCSWCYGFSTVIEKIREKYPELEMEIITGGYSPGNKEVMTEEYKTMYQRAWASVNMASGKPFDYSMKFANDTFCYDSEPSSRAMSAISELVPERIFEFMQLLQSSFYVNGMDITKEDRLADLAEEFGVERELFLTRFNSVDIINATREGFIKSRQLGVNGFPTLIGEKESQLNMITNGFQPFENIQRILDAWINDGTGSEYLKANSY